MPLLMLSQGCNECLSWLIRVSKAAIVEKNTGALLSKDSIAVHNWHGVGIVIHWFPGMEVIN
jgi:hypothetical protein